MNLSTKDKHEMIADTLAQIKPLTLNQYDECKVKTTERVRKLNGDRPTRESLKKEQEPLVTPLDFLLVIVFFAAFAISSLHIMAHAGDLAVTTYHASSVGIMSFINLHQYTLISQVGMILLAEASMLLFMTTWRLETKQKSVWVRIGGISLPVGKITISLVLAVVAMVFVFMANAASGVTLLEAIMPPIFTVGLGFQLERIFDLWLERRTELRHKFTQKTYLWDAANEEPQAHPEYRPLLMREIWDALSRIKQNADFTDASNRVKRAAVLREMERDNWVHEVAAAEAVAEAAGVDTTQDLPDDQLEQLLALIKAAPASNKGIISLPKFTADLGALTWTDVDSGRVKGPYRSRGIMQAGIATAIRGRARRA